MVDRWSATEPSALVREMAGSDLGDERLNGRRDRVMAVLEEHPDATFPRSVLPDDAGGGALSVFAQSAGPAADIDCAASDGDAGPKCGGRGGVGGARHDGFGVRGGAAAQGRLGAAMGPARQGFWLHAALAVSADGPAGPAQGLLALQPVRSAGPVRRRRRNRPRRCGGPTRRKESRCWGAGVAAVRDRARGDGRRDPRDGSRAPTATTRLGGSAMRSTIGFVVRLIHDPPSRPRRARRRARCRSGASRWRLRRGARRSRSPRPATAGDRPRQGAAQTSGAGEPRARRLQRRGVAGGRGAPAPAGQTEQLPRASRSNVVACFEKSSRRPGRRRSNGRLLTTDPIDSSRRGACALSTAIAPAG